MNFAQTVDPEYALTVRFRFDPKVSERVPRSPNADAILKAIGDRTMTAREIRVILGWSVESVGPRLTELKAAGKLKVTGTRRRYRYSAA